MNTEQKALIFLSLVPILGPLAIMIWFAYKDLKGEVNRVRSRIFVALIIIVGILASFAIVTFLNYLKDSVIGISDVIDKFGSLLSFLVVGAPVTVVTFVGLVAFWDWFKIK